MPTSTALVLIALTGLAPATDAGPETIRYTRPAKDGTAVECTFVIARDAKGWSITSTTDRGTTKMEVTARYDDKDRLLRAAATLNSDGEEKSLRAVVADGKATLHREGAEAQQFDVPPGTIVTSAPDWTDVFLLCRRFDRSGKEKQEFPALWVHPTQPAQRLTFTTERQGTDTIEHKDKKLALTRFQITIRGRSKYAAWADGNGQMIRLIPATAKDPTAGLTREGYEKAAAGLCVPR